MIDETSIRRNLDQLNDEHLKAVVTESADEYTPRAIEIARELIRERGLSVGSAPSTAESKRQIAKRIDEKVKPQSRLGWYIVGGGGVAALLFGLTWFSLLAIVVGAGRVAMTTADRRRAASLRTQAEVIETEERERKEGQLSPPPSEESRTSSP